jgi:hypothetical protein
VRTALNVERGLALLRQQLLAQDAADGMPPG